MRNAPATLQDIAPAADCISAAFHNAPLLVTFPGNSPLGRPAASALFFAMLLEARVRTGMPVILAWEEGQIAGVAMGDDAAPPPWPEDVQKGRGLDRALIHAFPTLSDQDDRSAGTTLETALESNLGLYRKFGFALGASGAVGSATLRSMSRPGSGLSARPL